MIRKLPVAQRGILYSIRRTRCDRVVTVPPQLQKMRRLHYDWVRSIRYIMELDALVSVCCETATAMVITNMQDMKSKYFVVNKGVICFDYSTVSIVSTVIFDKVLIHAELNLQSDYQYICIKRRQLRQTGYLSSNDINLSRFFGIIYSL